MYSRDVAMAVINSNSWSHAMKNLSINERSWTRDTPMRKLIRKMPSVAERVLHRCIDTQNPSTDPNYAVTFNFEYLDDMFSDWRDLSSDTMSMSESKFLLNSLNI